MQRDARINTFYQSAIVKANPNPGSPEPGKFTASFNSDHSASLPPSTAIDSPVMNGALSDARKTMV